MPFFTHHLILLCCDPGNYRLTLAYGGFRSVGEFLLKLINHKHGLPTELIIVIVAIVFILGCVGILLLCVRPILWHQNQLLRISLGS